MKDGDMISIKTVAEHMLFQSMCRYCYYFFLDKNDKEPIYCKNWNTCIKLLENDLRRMKEAEK